MPPAAGTDRGGTPTEVTAQSVLPPLYGAWMDALLPGPIPPEGEATCDDCAMCPTGGERRPPSPTFFDPAVKCCTYLPRLPNFLVGRILADADPAWAAGRATVEARLRRAVGVTPLGLGQPATYALLYDHGRAAFGRSRTLRCPHYLEDGGRCGIWRYRNGTCATWFCKHERGARGLQFWRTLHRLLTAVERTLAAWCVLDLGLSGKQLERLFTPAPRPADPELLNAADLDGAAESESYRTAWGDWSGREAAFFEECGRRVDTLPWSEIVRIGGPELRALAQLTGEAHSRLVGDELPDRLVLGPFHVLSMGPRRVRVWAYSGRDPLELPRVLLDVLPSFDGRPVGEVIRAVLANRRIRLHTALVRKLADFQILLPVASK